jgi:WD40 repeat protein
VVSLAFEPEGKLLAIAWTDNAVRLWDVETSQERRVLRGHEGQVRSLVFSPDGRLLVSGSSDKTIRLWHVGSGAEVAVLHGHEGSVESVAFSPDGRWIASGSDDRTVRLWDFHTGRELKRFLGDPYIDSILLSPDGRFLATVSADGILRVRECRTGRECTTFRGVYSVSFSPDGRFLACGSVEDNVSLWDFAAVREQRSLRGDTASSAAFSPDGLLLATGSPDGTVRLWNPETCEGIRVFHGWITGPAVSFSHDGRIVAGGSSFHLDAWDVASGEQLGVSRVGDVGDGCFRVHLSYPQTTEHLHNGVRYVTVHDSHSQSDQYFEYVKSWHHLRCRASNRPADEGLLLDSWDSEETETIVKDVATGKAVAWFPEPLWHASAAPNGRTWAGPCRGYFYLIRLEGGARMRQPIKTRRPRRGR